jgi:Arf-GAP/coiled-coil/ANK repeat/PH domain-containing protein
MTARYFGRWLTDYDVVSGNEKCCDCRSTDTTWASINLGVTLCIACSGVHRSLGVHISKVRSLTLDFWEPEILKVMAELGNTISNKIYEAQVHEIVAKRATTDSDKTERENWIKAKYVAKAFIRTDLMAAMSMQAEAAASASSSSSRGDTGKWTVRRLRRRTRTSSLKKQSSSAKEKLDEDEKDVDTKLGEVVKRSSGGTPKLNAEEILFGSTLGKHHVANIELDSDQESTDGEDEGAADTDDLLHLGKLTPNHLLYRAARVHNLPVMSQALALGADRDFFLPGGDSSVIHQSILSGSVMACEYLLLNGARINALDGEKNTPLHLAAKHGNTGQVCLLLKAKADHSKRNALGQLPVDIAIANSDADIVTVLRLASLKEEMGLEEGMGGGGGGGGVCHSDDTFNDVVQEFSQMVYTHPERLHKKGGTVDPKRN